MNPPFVVSCTLPGFPTTIFSAGMPEARIANTDELPLRKSVSQSSYPGLGDSASGHSMSVECDTAAHARRLTVIKLYVILEKDSRLNRCCTWRRRMSAPSQRDPRLSCPRRGTLPPDRTWDRTTVRPLPTRTKNTPSVNNNPTRRVELRDVRACERMNCPFGRWLLNAWV